MSHRIIKKSHASNKLHMSMSDNGMKFLIKREGNVTSMYKDIAGHCTIGVGHLIHKGNCDYPRLHKHKGFSETAPYLPNLSKSSENHLDLEKPYFNKISSQDVFNLLKHDVKRFEKVVNNYVTVPLTQNQFDALVSFSFNIGPGSFRSSTLLKVLNHKNYNAVPSEMKRWIHATTKDGKKGISHGLINRRAKESSLFSKGDYDLPASSKAPSPSPKALPAFGDWITMA